MLLSLQKTRLIKCSRLFQFNFILNDYSEHILYCFVCLFVLGFKVSLTLFQSYCDGTCMRQVRVLPHWNTSVAGTWQEHPTQSRNKLTPGWPTIFPSTHLSMPSVICKGATCTIFLRLLVCRGLGWNPQPSIPQAKNSTNKPPGPVYPVLMI